MPVNLLRFTPLLLCFFLSGWNTALAGEPSLRQIVTELSAHGDRRTGGSGYDEATKYIFDYLKNLGLEPKLHQYPVPVRRVVSATLNIQGEKVKLTPFLYNAVTPQSSRGQLSGPIYYVEKGSLTEMEKKPIHNSILLMDFDSGKNWLEAASLGAKALILIHRGKPGSRFLFEEKKEVTPLEFPIFWMEEEEAISLFGTLDNQGKPHIPSAVIESTIKWEEIFAKNIFALIEGTDPTHKNELVVIEGFFDNSAFIPGMAPGADEAASIATLLQTAASLSQNRPGRSVLLAATSGHDQTLAGFRELMWAISSSSKVLKKQRRQLEGIISAAEAHIEVLSALNFPLAAHKERDKKISQAIESQIKSHVDKLSRELVDLRLAEDRGKNTKRIDELVKKRFALRRLGWTEKFNQLSAKENVLLKTIIPLSMDEHGAVIKSTKQHLRALQSAQKLRGIVNDFAPAAFISLHLSSHGRGVGGFHQGWLYQLKDNINRTGIYSELGSLLRQTSQQNPFFYPYIDTLRSDRIRTWDSWFLGKPYHGGEVSSLAGFLGLTLATVGDARQNWGTPWDTTENINWKSLKDQQELVTSMIFDISWADTLSSGKLPKKGFSNVTGRANLLLQGELFANYPAQETIIMGFQGNARFYGMVDASGFFRIHGIADRKNVVDKLILEGYRYKDNSGPTIWAIDKKETGKSNYRLKIRRNEMKTDLTLFACKETTIFGLLEPRNFNYLNKIDLFDGRRDAPPHRYWYSRIDTRISTIASIYTEPGTWLKATLSDTILTRKIILSNSTKKNPAGFGYDVNQFRKIINTPYFAAKDIWTLLQPRIANLEQHGIIDTQINNLQNQGLDAMQKSTKALEEQRYGEFKTAALQALALAGRVYVQVEKTQKDVLFGVLFYIALFIPFAFCAERFLFNYANIYKRISAFLLLLVGLITIIYNVHPAFQLAYSPMVVILAFFIIGLSLMVSLIIFFRFEEEMVLLQRRASHKRPSEISHWKAFLAAFFLGVSNLRRRRLRTILTCLTLIILTFTIMSFTTVKSNQKPNRLFFQDKSPYNGILLKKTNWKSLPREAEHVVRSKPLDDRSTTSRIWLEGKSRTRPTPVPLLYSGNTLELSGLIGLSDEEPIITHIDKTITQGSWFKSDDRNVVLLSETVAAELGIDGADIGKPVSIWGMQFTLKGLFDGSLLATLTDLDGEPLSPVFFPQETSVELSEQEQEALESGDDVRSMQSRYQHIDPKQIAIIPSRTLFAMGGELKSVAIQPHDPASIPQLATDMVERFSLPLFVGEESGVWFFSPSNTLGYKGVPNILVPLIISIFIVLNTMISSVYERKNEIGVYTSVGLAPSHVSFLFIAEAMALAVISVVLGYLLAQVSAALFSTTSYWAGITVNYSSMAGVAAMLLVIAVVLISVIYPSHVAGKIAIPDVKRSFSLPQPVENTISVMLPFFMKYEEHESIGGFIHSYFNAHQDISHGLFSTGPVDIIFSCTSVGEIQQMILRADDPSSLNCMHLRANVWLAPFDFGIMQKVDIQFCPARENSQYLEIKISLERKSGELSMWQRINTLFIHDIRKQLLIWRSIDQEGHEQYQEEIRLTIEEQRKSQYANSG